MSSHNLPPVRNLPHWSRVGCLDNKPQALRPSPANKHLLQPLQGASPVDRGAPRGGGGGDGGEEVSSLTSLRRNIDFLQLQHKDTLQKLHAEVDHLRRENKELQYQLIMDHGSRKAGTPSQRSVGPAAQGSEMERGLYLEQPLQDMRPLQEQGLSKPVRAPAQVQAGAPELRGGLITSLNPLRIHRSAAHPPRAPTLQECEVIIRQLYNANSMQSQEIMRVKAVLRDIVFSKKITPENYILTKAYLADGNRKPAELERFPQLAVQQLPKKPSRRTSDGLILPALKQCLSSNVAERHKRTQAVQRSRLRRAVH